MGPALCEVDSSSTDWIMNFSQCCDIATRLMVAKLAELLLCFDLWLELLGKTASRSELSLIRGRVSEAPHY